MKTGIMWHLWHPRLALRFLKAWWAGWKHRNKNHVRYQLIIVNMVIWAIAINVCGAELKEQAGVEPVQALVVTKTEIIEVEKELHPQAWIAQRMADAGINPLEAAVVQFGESRGDVNAIGQNSTSVDLGIFQWNSQHIKSGLISLECVGSYKCATDAAIKKRLADGDWTAWYAAAKYGIK